MILQRSLTLLILLRLGTPGYGGDVVTFDYAWRYHKGDPVGETPVCSFEKDLTGLTCDTSGAGGLIYTPTVGRRFLDESPSPHGCGPQSPQITVASMCIPYHSLGALK